MTTSMILAIVGGGAILNSLFSSTIAFGCDAE